MRPHQGSVEGKENLPRPAGHTLLDAPQDPIGFLGSQGTLLAHGQPVVHQDTQKTGWQTQIFSEVGKVGAGGWHEAGQAEEERGEARRATERGRNEKTVELQEVPTRAESGQI